ncbi:MAG: protein kinase [Acidobacteriota bacterium]
MKFGRYETIDELCSGDGETVFRARGTAIDRVVTLKALSEKEAADPERKARFVREAQQAAGLSHEAILGTYDLGEEGGIPFVALEPIEGVDLEELVRASSPSLETKSRVLIQVARALDFAHEKGVSHGDLCLANVRLVGEGERAVKVIGFGVHLCRRGPSYYLAPERVAGGPASPAADLWSLGVLAYEVLTGRPPFHGTSTNPIAFHKAGALVHPRLQDVVFRLLEWDPALRYAHARDVVKDLESFLSDGPGRRKEAAGAFDKALTLYRAGSVNAAIVGWEEALMLDPDHTQSGKHLKLAREKAEAMREVKLLQKLASLYLDRGKKEKALHYFQEVLRVDPYHAVAQEHVQSLGGLGANLSAALVRADAVPLPKGPIRDAAGDVKTAAALLKKERVGEAISVLRDALARNPGDSAAQEQLSKIIKRIRKRVVAEKALVQECIERGNQSFRTERFQDAEEQWGRVLALDETNLIARKNLEILSAYLKDREPGKDVDLAYPEGQRFHARLPARFPARYRGLFSPHTEEREVELHRVSMSGISLLAKDPLPVSAVIQITMKLPGRETEVEALAQVLHSAPEPFGRHLIGTMLLLVPQAYADHLKTLEA